MKKVRPRRFTSRVYNNIDYGGPVFHRDHKRSEPYLKCTSGVDDVYVEFILCISRVLCSIFGK